MMKIQKIKIMKKYKNSFNIRKIVKFMLFHYHFLLKTHDVENTITFKLKTQIKII